MENIIIRRARVEDAEKIANIKVDGWKTAYKGIIDDDFLKSMDVKKEAERRRNIIENGANIIVAELEGEVIGFCIYRDHIENKEKYPNADCEISALYVTSKLKRNGIGRKLMLYVIELLKSKNKKRMILGCLKDNFPARVFYEKMGGKVFDYDELECGDKSYTLAMYGYDIENM